MRASRVPLVMICGQSAAPGIQVESANRDAADDGTYCHALMASLIGGAPTDFDTMPEDIRPAMFTAWRMWRDDIRPFFPQPLTEFPLSFTDDKTGMTLTGHPDLLSPPAALGLPEVRIGDWKFGYLDMDHDGQMDAYAFLALQRYTDADRAYVSVFRVREQSAESRYVTREESMAWYVKLIERTKDTAYRPGRHCAYCPRGFSCEAKEGLLQQSLALIRPNYFSTLPEEPEARARALEDVLVAARLVSKAAEDAQDLIRSEVRNRGGEFGNMRLTVQEQRKLSFPAALPILQAELGEELANILKASKTDCEKVIGAKAPPRGKGKAVQAFNERLAEAGALRVETIEKLTIQRQPKQLEAS